MIYLFVEAEFPQGLAMRDRCEYSSLSIPNEISYLDVAAAYVREVAKSVGFDQSETQRIALALKQAVTFVIEKAFEPGEKQTLELSCERVPAGLRVVIKEMGVPLDPQEITSWNPEPASSQDPGAGTDLLLMTDLVDEVSIHNLGPQGTEIHLLTYLGGQTAEDYLAACEPEVFEAAAPRPQIEQHTEFQIRLMDPSDALEVARSVYKAYGYSYFYEHAYYPERVAELNEAGKMVSAVALTTDGQFAGHAAIVAPDGESQVAEIGMAVVKPQFRGQGCLLKLTEFLVPEAEKRGFTGLYVRAVTNHTFSQQVADSLGFRTSAILLGYVPTTVSFKGMPEQLSQRGAFVVQYRYIRKPAELNLYAPPLHQEFISKLYSNLGVKPGFAKPAGSKAKFEHSSAAIKAEASVFIPEGIATMEVVRYGEDAVSQVNRMLKELRLQRRSLILLYLDMKDPLTFFLAKEFEALGFFFAGIFPQAFGRERLIMQYLNNVPVDYEKIRLHSKTGQEILNYIKAHDPNQL
jgi:anti-sigma regulatory factor (Ser/Thr protein kinase)